MNEPRIALASPTQRKTRPPWEAVVKSIASTARSKG